MSRGTTKPKQSRARRSVPKAAPAQPENTTKQKAVIDLTEEEEESDKPKGPPQMVIDLTEEEDTTEEEKATKA